jgi:hypothetical protein
VAAGTSDLATFSCCSGAVCGFARHLSLSPHAESKSNLLSSRLCYKKKILYLQLQQKKERIAKTNYAKFRRAKERSRVFSEDGSDRYKQKQGQRMNRKKMQKGGNY